MWQSTQMYPVRYIIFWSDGLWSISEKCVLFDVDETTFRMTKLRPQTEAEARTKRASNTYYLVKSDASVPPEDGWTQGSDMLKSMTSNS